jgi:hypothetical protein
MGGRQFDECGSGQGQVTSCCEHGNDRSGSLKSGECFDWLNNYYPLNKDSASCS